MKLGEIKIEALKLMFAGVGNDGLDVGITKLDKGEAVGENGEKFEVTVTTLDELKGQPEYSDYLAMMNGSINRCFSLIEERRVLPSKRVVLNFEGKQSGEIDLSLISDLYDIERIVYEGRGGYQSSCEYYREGDVVIIKEFDGEGEYRLLYKPKLERISPMAAEDTEITMPDGIACLIPYYIKSELYRMDEPDEAAEARNRFEASLAEMKEKDAVRQTRVESRYSFGEV